MGTQFWGILSGVLVALSGLWYVYRVYKGEVTPHITCWLLWTLIGAALLATYKSAGSGKEYQYYAAVIGFINPLVIFSVTYFWKGEWHKPDWVDWLCVALALVALSLWAILQLRDAILVHALFFVASRDWAYEILAPLAGILKDPKLLAYAGLCLALLADGFTTGPMIRAARKDPMIDRPGPWALFSVASAVSMLAIEEHTVADYVYPVYMFLGAGAIAYFLWRGNVRMRNQHKEIE